jgi:oligogalacturonide transport system ATP-binding protein
MAALSLRGIEKVYPNGFKAVHGVDLQVADGEFMVFVGPSGCAKSTLLRMIAGLESISGGELQIGGTVVNALPAKQRGIAMVFQNYALYPHMKVWDNLAFGLKLSGMPKAQLSGGQAQRVAVGRAIVKRPGVFLFDEPLSNLDAKLRASMRVRLTELHKTLRDSGHPSTVVYVTHDQVEAMTMGERICVLQAGTIQQVDRPSVLYERPANAFVAGFIGSPEMNLHEVQLDRGAGTLRWGDVTVAVPANRLGLMAPAANGPVRLGLRPEHLHAQALRSDTVAVAGRLRFLENMGSEVFVHVDIGGLPFTARVAPDALGDLDHKARGDTHTLHLQMAQSHLFDAASGHSLLA